MNEIGLRAWVYSREQLDSALECPGIEMIYAPSEVLDESNAGYAGKIIALTPEFLGGAEEKTERELQRIRALGFDRALAHTVGHIELLQKAGFAIHGGARLNCTNSEAMRFFADCGLSDITVSQELTVKQINALDKPIPTGFTAYGKTALMLNRRCPVRDGRPCGGKDRTCDRLITDRKGNRLDVLCSENSVEILNSDTLILSDRLADFRVDFAVLRFTTETDVSAVTENYMKGRPPFRERFTRGLYYRGVS